MKERTIEKSISCYGVGLHSGQKVRLTFHPFHAGAGVVFKVHSPDGSVQFISCRGGNVVDTTLATTLGCIENGTKVKTVEHVLAAVRGLRIDNLLIEVEGGEVPIMDGSAFPFVYLLKQAGVQQQSSRKKAFKLRDEVIVQDGKGRIIARPSLEPRIKCHIDFSHPMIAQQTFSYKPSPDNFESELAKARTFGFFHQVEELKKSGLIKGGGLDNAVVFGETEILNPQGLRFPDEPVRHKLLDFIGDISLLGYELLAEIEVVCSGHGLNNHFVLDLAAGDLLSLVDYPDKALGLGVPEKGGVPKHVIA